MHGKSRRPRPVFGSRLFVRRVIVVIPPWSIPILTLGIAGGIALTGLTRITSIVSLICTAAALWVVLVSRYQVRKLGDEVRAVISGVLDDDDVLLEMHREALPTKVVDLASKKVNNVNRHEGVSGT